VKGVGPRMEPSGPFLLGKPRTSSAKSVAGASIDRHAMMSDILIPDCAGALFIGGALRADPFWPPNFRAYCSALKRTFCPVRCPVLQEPAPQNSSWPGQ